MDDWFKLLQEIGVAMLHRTRTLKRKDMYEHDCILYSRKHYLEDVGTQNFLMVCDRCHSYTVIPKQWIMDDPDADPGWLWIFKAADHLMQT